MDMNIVYGGAFNPPTIAHKKIMECIIDNFHPSCLILLPVGSAYNKNKLASEQDRFNMLKILADKTPNTIVSNLEFEKKFVGTYMILEELNFTFPNIYYVIGADNLEHLSSWLNYEKLINKYHFIVFGRKGIDMRKIIRENYLLYQEKFILIDFDIDVSSTEIRNNLDSKKLDEDVYEYILNNHLYEEENI